MIKIFKCIVEIDVYNSKAFADHLWSFHKVFPMLYFFVNGIEVDIFKGYNSEEILEKDSFNIFDIRIKVQIEREFEFIEVILNYSISKKDPSVEFLPLVFHIDSVI